MNAKETPLRIDAVTNAVLLNRYMAFCTFKRFNTEGNLAENVEIESGQFYQVQWKNIWLDVKGLVTRPRRLVPQIGYSLAAFAFIALGRHTDAVFTSFFMGALAFDAASQTSHSGEPGTITWSHTVGSGSDRFLLVATNGLSATNAPQYGAVATTNILSVGSMQAGYQVAPTSGAANCTADGGNIKVGGSVSYTGADQTDPIGASTTEDGSSSPNDMALTTEAANSVRFDILGANRDDATDPTGSLDSGGDLRCNDVVPQNQFRIGLFIYTIAQAVAGADTHQWTTSGFNRWYGAFELKAVSATAHTKSLTDTVAIAEVLSKTPKKFLTDTVTASEVLGKTDGVKKTDTVTISEVLSKKPGKIMTDLVTLSDTLAKTARLNKTETVTLADTLIKLSRLNPNDTLTLVDVLNRIAAINISDTINIIDALSKAAGKIQTDTVTVSEIVLKATGKTLTELVAIADTHTKTTGKNLTDTVSVADSLIKTIGKVISDTLTIVDSLVLGGVDFIGRIYEPLGDRFKKMYGKFSSKSTKSKKKLY